MRQQRNNIYRTKIHLEKVARLWLASAEDEMIAGYGGRNQLLRWTIDTSCLEPSKSSLLNLAPLWYDKVQAGLTPDIDVEERRGNGVPCCLFELGYLATYISHILHASIYQC
jgi:hypothetical protein